MKGTDESFTKNVLFVGSQPGLRGFDFIRQLTPICMNEELEPGVSTVEPSKWPIFYNCGIIGGYRSELLVFLGQMNARLVQMRTRKKEVLCDMVVLIKLKY